MKKYLVILGVLGLNAWGFYQWTRPTKPDSVEEGAYPTLSGEKHAPMKDAAAEPQDNASQAAAAEKSSVKESSSPDAVPTEEEILEAVDEIRGPAMETPKLAADKPQIPEPKDLADTAAVQAFLKQKTIAKPNAWNSFPLFQDKDKFSRYFKGLYKGALIGMDGVDLGKDLEIDFDQLRMNEADASLSGMVTLGIFNRTLGRYERKSQPSGEGLTMFRQSGVDDSITVSWRGGRPSKELLQIFFPKESNGEERLFGTFYRKEGQSHVLVPTASFVIVRQAS